MSLAFAASAAAGFQGSWLDRALESQYRLAGDVPLRNAPWIGTHNSFNSVAEMGPTTSTLDPNQQLSITEQLTHDVRAIELDVHWTLSPSAGGLAPVVCHAFPSHFPCSTEKTLGPVLEEIGAWLRGAANSEQVLFLYLEDHLDDQTGYDTAAAIIREKLGDLLYLPREGAGCQPLPMSLTRDRMLAAGARVIVVGNSPCGVGSAWPSVVFDWQAHLETQLSTFSDFPTCGSDYTRAQYEATQIRYYEDGRPSQGGRPRITPQVAAEMARCGVDLIGLDQLAPEDPRLKALVWSWKPGQPGKGRCAVQTSRPGSLATGWRTLDCGKDRRPACRRGSRWTLGGEAAPQDRGRAVCRRTRHAQFAVPRTGYEAQLLREAMQGAHVGQAWLGYAKRPGGWVALDQRRG
ncbi:MAG: phosphatidylinositol-specific phospholipase C domain-containing protein [Syntrophothermus sp.]